MAGSGTGERRQYLYERGDDLRRARNAYLEAVTEQDTRVVAVVGEPGIGKSAFLSALGADIRAAESDGYTARPPLILSGATVSSASVMEAYLPIERALTSLIGEPTTEPVLQRAVRTLWTELPSWLALFPTIGPAVSRAEQLRREVQKSGRAFRPVVGDPRRIDFLGWLERNNARLPIVFLFDDMQWADRSTLDLLATVAARRSSGAVLLVMAYREVPMTEHSGELSTIIPAILAKTPSVEIELRPLSAAGVASTIRDLRGERASRQLVERIFELSRGNPLFVEVLVAPPVEMHLRETERVEAPQALGRLLDSWIDLLPDDQLRVLQATAVLGSELQLDDVAEVADMDRRIVGRCADALLRDWRLVDSAQVGDGEWGYVIRHPLVAERVRVHLERDRRLYLELHRRAADLMLPRAQQGDLRSIGAVARHLKEGRGAPRATEWCLRAARANQMAGAHYESERYARWALELGAEDPQQAQEFIIEAHQLLGLMRLELRRLSDAARTLARGVALAQRMDVTHHMLAWVRLSYATALRMCQEWAPARDLLEKVRADLATTSIELVAATDLLDAELALCSVPEGRTRQAALDRANAHLTRALASRDPRRRVAVFGYWAILKLASGFTHDALLLLARAQDEAVKAETPSAAYEGWEFSAQVHLALMRLSDAQYAIDQMSEITARSGIDDTEYYLLLARLLALDPSRGDAGQAYNSYLLRESERCRARWPEAHIGERRKSWAIQHLVSQADELLTLHGPRRAEQFLRNLDATLNYQALSRTFVELPRLIQNLIMETRRTDRPDASQNLELNSDSRPDAALAFDFYIDDLQTFRRSLSMQRPAD